MRFIGIEILAEGEGYREWTLKSGAFRRERRRAEERERKGERARGRERGKDEKGETKFAKRKRKRGTT